MGRTDDLRRRLAQQSSCASDFGAARIGVVRVRSLLDHAQAMKFFGMAKAIRVAKVTGVLAEREAEIVASAHLRKAPRKAVVKPMPTHSYGPRTGIRPKPACDSST